MRPEEFRGKLRGVIAFPVTPFKPDLSLDLAGLRENIQQLLRHPIAAIVAAGGTGEMYSLTPAELLSVVKTIVEEVRDQLPVISGTGFNRQMAIELAQQSAQAGVDGILALPPYYPNADDEGLADYYSAIGAATPLGLFVYSRDWVKPSPEWVAQLAARIPTLIAWKDGQGDTARYKQIMDRVGDRLYWIGGAADPVLVWTAFTALTGLAWGLISLIVFRFLFGAGEAGAFPNISRASREWFPFSERGFTRGWFGCAPAGVARSRLS